MDERTIDDPRTLVPPYLRAQPPDDPPAEPPTDRVAWTDERDRSDFWVALLAAGAALGLVGLARLAWNVAEGELWQYGSFWGFYVLDKSVGYFTAFSNFVIAAGVWRLAFGGRR